MLALTFALRAAVIRCNNHFFFARRPRQQGNNDYHNKALLAGQMSAGVETAARQGKKPNLRQASDKQLITPA